CASLLPTRTWDFHPLENAHAGQTKTRGKPAIFCPVFPSFFQPKPLYLVVNALYFLSKPQFLIIITTSTFIIVL
ncbi:hypothetical protein, partial [Enterocloster clostridioformis]